MRGHQPQASDSSLLLLPSVGWGSSGIASPSLSWWAWTGHKPLDLGSIWLLPWAPSLRNLYAWEASEMLMKLAWPGHLMFQARCRHLLLRSNNVRQWAPFQPLHVSRQVLALLSSLRAADIAPSCLWSSSPWQLPSSSHSLIVVCTSEWRRRKRKGKEVKYFFMNRPHLSVSVELLNMPCHDVNVYMECHVGSQRDRGNLIPEWHNLTSFLDLGVHFERLGIYTTHPYKLKDCPCTSTHLVWVEDDCVLPMTWGEEVG